MSPLSEEELDTMLQRERGRDFAPLNDWETISARLRAEGLLRDHSTRFAATWWMRAAAAVLIAAGGVAVGRYSASRLSTGSPSSATVVAEQPGQAAQPPAQNATDATAASFRSADDAWAALNKAGQDYQRASAYLNAVQTARSDSSGVYKTRLAALDKVMRATESAREQAPNDPVINQYYLATMGAREATAQQLHTAQLIGPKPKGF